MVKSIKGEEIVKLWVNAGGRCEYPGCNEFLLKDKLTGRLFNFGEMAHNVGRKKTKGSPRGLNPLSLKDREKAANHLLLCGKHHKLVDTGKYLAFYTIEELRIYKEEHENRIMYLTGLNDTRKSVVIRMMNKIHGDSVAISNEEIMEALWKCSNRYPEYLLKTQNNLEIDLSDLPDSRDSSYWQTAKHRIDEVIDYQLKPQIRKQINHISVFALAPIPLMIYLGSRLGDKLKMDVYQKQHNLEENWVWNKDSSIESFSSRKVQERKNDKRVAIILSISGKVSPESLPNDITKNYTIYEIYPQNNMPNRSLVENKQTLLNFKKTYQILLREIESRHLSAKQIMVFPAVPVAVAILCGRGLLKAVSPKLMIYENINNKFQKAVALK